MIGQVVERHEDRRAAHDRVIGVALVTPDGGRTGVPVMQVDDIDRTTVGSQNLYRLLEEEIIPRYYERDANGLPKRWLGVMHRAMSTSLWRFSTTRMLHEYVERLYLPAAGVPVIGATGPSTAFGYLPCSL